MNRSPLVSRFLAATPDSGTGQAVLWIGILIVVAILGGLIMMAVRRRILSKDSLDDGTTSLMDQLRAMRDRGQISPEEYEATRRTMREKMARSVSAKPGAHTPTSDKKSRA